MNDIMSFGVHRLWKKNLISWMSPQLGSKIVDVASGTGDLAKAISEKNNNQNSIYCVEPNQGMLETGKKKLKYFKNVKWHLYHAEKLPFKDNLFDFYTISFGIRNVTDINQCLKEAYLNALTSEENETVIPNHEDIPKILNKVYPNHDVVKIE